MEMNVLNGGAAKTALLIHPMLANAEVVKDLIASRLGDGWRFLIPDLSGHGTSRKYPFTESAKEADDIHSFLEREGIRHLDFVWGASLGAAVAFALMRYVDASFGTMVLDGTPFMSAGSFVTGIVQRKMVGKHRKAVKDRELSVRKMTDLYGTPGPIMADEFINMDENSIRYIMKSCGSSVYPVLSEEQQKNTVFLFGEKDMNLRPARKRIPEDYPSSELRILEGFDHCEMIGKDPDGYVDIIRSYIPENLR